MTRDATPLPEAELSELRRQLMQRARRSMHDHGLAEDIVQDTLVAVIEGHGGRRGTASLVTWSMAILKHKIADWYRSPAREHIVHATHADAASGEAFDMPAEADADAAGAHAQRVPAWQQPDGQAERRQALSALERCMRELPQQAGRVFMMREWMGFGIAEICARLSLTAANCRKILHRARKALRTCMVGDCAQDGKDPGA